MLVELHMTPLGSGGHLGQDVAELLKIIDDQRLAILSDTRLRP